MANAMPKVIDCQATQCVYNKDRKCHTPAITVGDKEPCCDTFFQIPEKGGMTNITGCVGACKVSECAYNNAFECSAPGIHVIVNKDHADCGTFKSRE